ncbi:hypothetical protein [Brumicola pallidula]|uniref:hypothetical protein n=1 Tax=Brumicola pallidula TaxID=56807 RepID=UPI00187290CB|nr:hypothetical protein [Glaciecola pallidula]
MTKLKQTKYMSGDIGHLINEAIQNELVNLSATLAEIKDPIQRLNFLARLMPFFCAPVKQFEVSIARSEVGENEVFFLYSLGVTNNAKRPTLRQNTDESLHYRVLPNTCQFFKTVTHKTTW